MRKLWMLVVVALGLAAMSPAQMYRPYRRSYYRERVYLVRHHRPRHHIIFWHGREGYWHNGRFIVIEVPPHYPLRRVRVYRHRGGTK